MEKHKVILNIDYLGDLHTKITHPSGNGFLTDAPLDNNGKAEFISPTDLAAASIASCVATIMGIKAQNSGMKLEGLKITIEKEMKNEPFRMIKSLSLNIYYPKTINKEDRKILDNVVKTCPVTRSLHPDIELNYTFHEAG